MKHGLSQRMVHEISQFAENAGVQKVILFGSRARGSNNPRSDVDLAVSGGDFDAFFWAVKEQIHSLLLFDVVDLDKGISEELMTEIKRDGVTIYEKAG